MYPFGWELETDVFAGMRSWICVSQFEQRSAKCGGGAVLLCSWWKRAHAWVQSGVIEENPSRLSWSRSPSVAKSIRVKAYWNNELVRVPVYALRAASGVHLSRPVG